MVGTTKVLIGAQLLALVCVAAVGCNSLTGANDIDLSRAGHGGAGAAGGAGGGATTTTSHSTSSSTTSTSSTTSSTSSTTSSTSSTTSSTTTDPWEQYRQECIDKINALRATETLTAYTRWTSAESCVDQQATHDKAVNIYHDAFRNGTPACGGFGQNECPNYGAAAISSCLQQMWDERLQAGCSGCDACDTWTIAAGNCPNCSFYGPPVCGHYVNMSSTSMSSAACGFSTDGSWAAINFQ